MRNGGGEDPQPRRSGSCRPVLPVRASILHSSEKLQARAVISLWIWVCA